MTDDVPVPPPDPARDLGDRVVRGAAWMLGLRWVMRLIGLFSTAVLARLLTPEDFGVMAVAMVVYALITVLRVSGVANALIRLPAVDKDHYDTAWTVEIALAVIVALLLLAGGPLAAQQFKTPEIAEILWCMALMALMAGFNNTGMIEYRREITLQRHFVWQATGRLIGVAATIAAAVILRNYWALVIGMVVQSFANLVLSYVFHPLRPRLSLKAKGDIVNFSFWSVISSAANVLSQRLDQLMLAGNVSTGALGQYNRATELGDMLTRELVAPLSPIALSAYSKVQLEVQRLRRGVLRAFGFACLLSFPAGIGAAVMADDVVYVILGSQWSDTALLLQIAALGAMAKTARVMIKPLYYTQGRVRLLTGLLWAEVVLLAGAFYVIIGQPDIVLQNMLLASLVIAFVFSTTLVVTALRAYPGILLTLLAQMARILAAAGVMALAVAGSYTLADLSPLVSVLVRVPLGAVVFAGAVYAIWVMFGRPDGAEGEALDRIRIHGKQILNRLGLGPRAG